MLPKLVITDIDGVWTDGSMYYDQTDNEFKRFNTSDSAGVLFCSVLNIPVAIMTSENTKIVERRAQKLKINYLFQGVRNKEAEARALCLSLGIKLEDVAYMGDDLMDIPLLQKVGWSSCPANAPDYVKDKVKFVTRAKGGDGAFREFVEKILKDSNRLTEAIDKVLSSIEDKAKAE